VQTGFSLIMRWKLRKRSALSRAVGVGLGLVLTSLTAQTGCFTHNCDPSLYDYYGGRILPDNTYETNAIDEPWLDYPGNVTIRVHYPRDVGNAGWSIIPAGYIGLSKDANVDQDANLDPNGTTSQAAGQLAEYSSFSGQGFSVLNATCAHYYARFTVHFDTLDTGADAEADAGTE